MSSAAGDGAPASRSAIEGAAPLAFTIVTRSHFHLAAAWVEQLQRVDPTGRALVVVADADDPISQQPNWDWLAECHVSWRSLTNETHQSCWMQSGAILLRSARQLAPDHHWRSAFQYTPLELTCYLKGRVAAALWERGERHVLYADADAWLFDSITHCLAPIAESGGILLTPHLQHPLPVDGCYPTNLDLLRAGTFNAGVIGWSGGNAPPQTTSCVPLSQAGSHKSVVEQSTNGAIAHEIPAFLQWWNGCNEKHCIVDPGLGLFVDQRWLDHAPGLFQSVVISRHLGLNVGYWNLHDRSVHHRDNRWWVAQDTSNCATSNRDTYPCDTFPCDTYPRGNSPRGNSPRGAVMSRPITSERAQPLQVFHFSGAARHAADGAPADHRLSRHQNRHALPVHSGLATLVQAYLSAWTQHAEDHYTRLPYAYGLLNHGVPIAPEWRDAYRLNACDLRETELPFAAFGTAEGVEQLRQAASPPNLPPGRLQHQIDALHAKIDQLKQRLDRLPWRRLANAAKRWRHRWLRKAG